MTAATAPTKVQLLRVSAPGPVYEVDAEVSFNTLKSARQWLRRNHLTIKAADHVLVEPATESTPESVVVQFYI